VALRAKDVACPDKNRTYRPLRGDSAIPLDPHAKTEKMTRPKKIDGTRRTLRVDIRLNSLEQHRLFQQATSRGLSVSDYIRLTVLDSKPLLNQTDPGRASLIKGLGELGKIGSNINQIAKQINTDHKAGRIPAIPADVITGALYGVQTLSDHLLKILSAGH